MRRMISLFILLVSFSALNEARDCGDGNNGGCSQNCIDRNDGNGATCSCDCYYELDTDLETCVPITPCGVDLLWLNDFSYNVMNLCIFVQNNIETPDIDYTPFETFRDVVAQYITAFDTDVANGDIVVGTMLNGRTLDVTNDFGAVTSTATLASEISGLTKDDICGSNNVIQALYRTFDNGAVNNVIQVPSNANDGTTTTRVAVVGLVSPAGVALDSVLDTYFSKIHEYYDHVFVYGRDDTSLLDATLAARYDPQLRYLACNDSTANPCPYLFYTDTTNDNGATFDSPTVNPMIDTSACIKRKTVNVHTVSCGITEMTVTIPSCLLSGQDKSDLVLNNVSCTGDTHAAVSGDNVVFTIDYDDCSWTFNSETIDSVEYVTYTQNVVTKNYGVSSNIKQLYFESSCKFPRYTDEQLGIINPAVASLSNSVEIDGEFTVDASLYQSSAYSTAYSSSDFPVTLDVLDPIYLAVSTTLPNSLKLILKDIVVTTDTDKSSSPSYNVLTSQCADDDTFALGATTDTEIRFSLVMFEFVETVNEDNGSKSPLYFHITTYICEDTDTSDACTQSCASGKRKKRDVTDADIPVQHKTIGPFYTNKQRKGDVERNSEANKNVISRIVTNPEDKDASRLHLATYEIYMPSPSLGVLCYWVLLLASTALMFYLLSKFFTKSHQNMANAEPWNNSDLPTAIKG